MKLTLAVFFGLGLMACQTSPQPKNRPAASIKIHPGSAWFVARAETLGVSVEDATRRDAALSDAGPPDDVFWDDQLRMESAGIWRALCNECHPGLRSLEAARSIPPPPPDWAKQAGLYFGHQRKPQEMFRAIYLGGEPQGDRPSEMPAWNGKLSREQIWGLVYYLEHESRSLTAEQAERAYGGPPPAHP